MQKDVFINEEIWDPGESRIKWTFVGARGWELSEDQETSSNAKEFMKGDWKLSMESPRGKRDF